MSFPLVAPLDRLKQQDLLRRGARPRQMEWLEPRRLLAASIVDNTLTITGTAGDDAITFTRSGANEVTATVNGQPTVFELDEFRDLVIDGLDGDDQIVIGDDSGGDAPHRNAATVNSGAGNDTIEGGNSWWLNYDAGDGDDHVTAGTRESSGRLGAGNDTFVGGEAADQVWGDAGNDSITGNGGDDELFGGAGDDWIDGGTGDDGVTGQADNDTIIGGAGFDILDGGAGTDSVVGNADEDVLFNGENAGGDDNTVFLDAGGIIRITGTPRKDLVSGNHENGVITIQFGIAEKTFVQEAVNGLHADLGDGDDYIDLRPSNPASQFGPPATLLGGNGNDDLTGSGGADIISGGSGNDSLKGGWGNDQIEGGAGRDALDGGDGTDTLVGGPGDDTFRDGVIDGVTLADGLLKFVGTLGDDQVSVWADGAGGLVVWSSGVTETFDITLVNRIELWGDPGDDLLKLHPYLAIPALIRGGDGTNRLIGGAGNDTIVGGTGADHITGNGGDDFIDGRQGTDVMLGGAGYDTVDYSWRNVALVIGLDGWQDDGEAGENDLAYLDIERVLGGHGNDRIGGSSADNQLYGGPGDDTIGGHGGNDSLFGEAGNDKVHGDDGDDYIEAGAGHDKVYGNGGADILLGLAGNDQLFSAGDGTGDSVSGGPGTDSADADELDVLSGVEIQL